MQFAVIGHPIAHSLSPMLHETWLKAAGLFGCYTTLDVEGDGLEAFVQKVRKRQFDGINVTIPHKSAIIPFLDRLEPAAARAGSAHQIRPEG